MYNIKNVQINTCILSWNFALYQSIPIIILLLITNGRGINAHLSNFTVTIFLVQLFSLP